MTPADVMTHPKFDWAGSLQDFLVLPGVRVNALHPIFGLRLAAYFIHLETEGLASRRPGAGIFRIDSGARTEAEQVALYNDICKRQNRCAYVANPFEVHGVDAEGTARRGSNHMEQRTRWGARVGYAVDLDNRRKRDDMTEAQLRQVWAPAHDIMQTYGLDWPLKGDPFEPWHVEWFPRRNGGPLDGPVAWPDRPGVHRPLLRMSIGGDVTKLQEQIAKALDLELVPPGRGGPNTITRDGKFGTGTDRYVRNVQHVVGRSANGVWDEADQLAYEAYYDANKPGLAEALKELETTAAATLATVQQLRRQYG